MAAALTLIAFTQSGCGNKEASQKTTSPPSAAATVAPPPGTAAPDQGKITTGADPGQAPAYPSMYGKPAGAK